MAQINLAGNRHCFDKVSYPAPIQRVFGVLLEGLYEDETIAASTLGGLQVNLEQIENKLILDDPVDA